MLQNLSPKQGFFGMKMIQKGLFRVCFSIILREKPKKGHIVKQDNMVERKFGELSKAGKTCENTCFHDIF